MIQKMTHPQWDSKQMRVRNYFEVNIILKLISSIYPAKDITQNKHPHST